MGRMDTNSIANAKMARISDRERLFLQEIGSDVIDSASSFVAYIKEVYGIPQSSSWYCLKRLKRLGLLSFHERGSEGSTGLFLTDNGIDLSRQRYIIGERSGREGRITLINERTTLLG